MSILERQVQAAQRRLWLNRWFDLVGRLLLAGCGVWFVCLLIGRLLLPTLRLDWIAAAEVVAALVGATVWLFLTREPRLIAAVQLDRAAGLKERISTGLCCLVKGQTAGEQNRLAVPFANEDPFAQAVVHDAETIAGRINVRQFIPLRGSPTLVWSGVAAFIAFLLFWMVPQLDLLGKAEAHETLLAREQELREVKATLSRPIETVRSASESNPRLKELAGLEDLERLARPDGASLDPPDLRREAIKRLDRARDELRKEAQTDRFTDVREMQRRLSELGTPTDPNSSVSRLTQALATGDLNAAQKELRQIQEQLARRQHNAPNDSEIKKMAEQLDELAKRLDALGRDKQLEERMKRAGLTEEEMKRVLEALNKKDIRQLEKVVRSLEERLKKQGVSQDQIEKLKQQIKQSRQNKSNNQSCRNLGNKMQSCVNQMRSGNMDGAAAQLGEMAEELSEMEIIEQELAQLETSMEQLNKARDDISRENDCSDGKCGRCGSCQGGECGQCNGTGFRMDGAICPHCEGQGSGMGSGRGVGDRPFGDGPVDFVKRKAKVKTGKGATIGSWFVKGEQIKGEARAEYREATEAAVRDAVDALDKDMVPRAYQRAVRTYFDRLGEADLTTDATQTDAPQE
jgi:tetratricopeptide (TPR) repeat protein